MRVINRYHDMASYLSIAWLKNMNKNKRFTSIEYALELVADILQNELAIGYSLQVTGLSDTHIDIMVTSPELCCPPTVKVSLTAANKTDAILNREQILEDLNHHLMTKRV